MSLDIDLITPQCDCCGRGGDSVFETNITHNLTTMARAAGIYEIVWRPEQCDDVSVAGDIVDRLSAGIRELDGNQDKYEAYNAENGWGLYKHFVPFLEQYRDACVKYPTATIEVSR
jgi:hypothetical protein